MRPALSDSVPLRRPWLRTAIAFGAALLASAATAQTSVRFTLDWRVEGPAAPFTVALDKGYFKAEGLDVTIEPAAGPREALTRVVSGPYDIGVGDVNALVRLRDETPRADVKAVMVLHDRPAFAIVGRRSRGIARELASLRGKTLGGPAADSAFAQWPVFKSINGIDEADWKMRVVTIGFPVREPMLAQGEVDAVFGDATSTYVGLKARGVPAEDIVALRMSDHGLELYGSVILVSQRFLAERPEAVRGFLRAVVRGLKDTVADPSAAVDTVLKRNDMARKEVELERLNLALDEAVITPWVRENGVGGIDRARFERALDQLALGAPFRQKPKVDDVFVDAFLPPADERKMD